MKNILKIKSNGETYYVQDKVRIKKDIDGVTAIDRGKTYTIDAIYDKTPCSVFKNSYDDEPCLHFEELPTNHFSPRHFYIVQRRDEDFQNLPVGTKLVHSGKHANGEHIEGEIIGMTRTQYIIEFENVSRQFYYDRDDVNYINFISIKTPALLDEELFTL